MDFYLVASSRPFTCVYQGVISFWMVKDSKFSCAFTALLTLALFQDFFKVIKRSLSLIVPHSVRSSAHSSNPLFKSYIYLQHSTSARDIYQFQNSGGPNDSALPSVPIRTRGNYTANKVRQT